MAPPPDRQAIRARATIAAATFAVLAIATASGSAPAQESAASQGSEDDHGKTENTLVARFALPSRALEDVASSSELVAALREHLSLDLSMPVAEPLQVTLHGLAGHLAESSGPIYRFGWSSLGVRYRGPGSRRGLSYALAVRESHGADFPPDGDEWEEFEEDEWSEDEAWSRLVEALDVGLRQTSSRFAGAGEGGHAALTVAGVHLREFRMADRADSAWADFGNCCDGFGGRAVLQLRPDVSYPSSMGAGTGGDPAARLNVLVIELAPRSADGAAPATAGAGLTPADTEAFGMTQTLLGACGAPQLQTAGPPGTAEIVLDGEPRTAEAIVAVDGDVDRVLRLGGGEGDDRLCLILMGRGGPTASGTFEVRKLSMEAMHGGSNTSDPWIAAALGIGADGRSLVVADGGSIEIEELAPTVRGRFELTGWRSDGRTRGATVEIEGTFDAAPAEP